MAFSMRPFLCTQNRSGKLKFQKENVTTIINALNYFGMTQLKGAQDNCSFTIILSSHFSNS